MHILLLHGMGRTTLSLARLARRLRADGHSVERLGYIAALERFEAIRAQVRARLAAAAARGGSYAAIGHSLGGLVLRAALASDPPIRARVAKLMNALRPIVIGVLAALLPCVAAAQRAAVPDDFPGLTWCQGAEAVSRIRADVQDSLVRAQLEAHEAVHRAQAMALASCEAFLSGLTSARRVIDVELPAYCAQWRVAVGQGGNAAELRREFAWRIAAQSGAMENRLQVVQRFEQECQPVPAPSREP